LYQGSDIEWLDLGRYIESVCKDLQASVPHCSLHASVDLGIEIATDRAISSALIVNELVMNACKHAYDGARGEVWVLISRVGETGFSISVRDNGRGAPSGFDPRKAKGLGMRLIIAFAQQLNGQLEIRNADPGTEFLVIVPHSPRPLPLQSSVSDFLTP
jgi:two-component sensor histidine kinase